MTPTHLKPESFASWQEYYWTYQNLLAERYYIPLFESWGVTMKNKKILDVGCGDGGFTAGLAQSGAQCTGVEVRDFGWPASQPNLRFLQQDILAADAHEVIGSDYDIIVLRDVIEHIPRQMKYAFMEALQKFMRPNGIILMTFPPFYSPFGLHQQTLLKSFLKKIPFLSWIPGVLLENLLSLTGESSQAKADVIDIRDCQMTLGQFQKMVDTLSYTIEHEKYYLIRPSHELRYGWKLRESRLAQLPLIREIFVLGTVFQLSIPQK